MGDWYRSGLPGSYQYLTPDIDLRNFWKESICFQWDKTGMESWQMDTRTPVQRECTYLTLSVIGFRHLLESNETKRKRGICSEPGYGCPVDNWPCSTIGKNRTWDDLDKTQLSTLTTLTHCQTQMRSFSAEVNVKGGFVVSRDIRPLIWDIVSEQDSVEWHLLSTLAST